MDRVSLLGIKIDRFTFEELISQLDRQLAQGRRGYVVTPNVDHVVQLKKDSPFRDIHAKADYVVPDGTPLLWAAEWLGKPLPERITGADLFPKLCSLAAQRGRSVFLLGSTPKVSRQTAARLKKLHPALKIAGSYSPPFGFEKCRDEMERIVRLLKKQRPDIVFVGLGAPKQEKLIQHLWPQVPVKLFLGVGAAMEFFSGEKKRAPRWVREAGLEWAFRLLSEPERLWKRYLLDDPRFFWWVAKEKFWGAKSDLPKSQPRTPHPTDFRP